MTRTLAATGTITYGEGAHDRFRDDVDRIPLGYVVALTVENGEGSVDGKLLWVDADGVTIDVVDDDGDEVGETFKAGWEDLAGVHIY